MRSGPNDARKLARRFFVEGLHTAGSTVEISAGDAHKIVHVLRLRHGDAIEIVDSSGAAFAAAIDGTDRVVRALLTGVIATGELDEGRLRVDLAQAVPKGRRMDIVIEKTTELGVASILPFYCERSVARNAAAAKVDRWQRIARSSAQQCGRRYVPEVAAPLAFDALLERFAGYDTVLFPWELAPRIPLRETLPRTLEGAGTALVVIGPEGGFAHHEAEAAADRGAALLWLGPRILRTETAAFALLAVIDALVA